MYDFLLFLLYRKIVEEKIDTNKDGKVSADELKQWIQQVSRRYLVEDGNKQWTEYNVVDNKLSWEEYEKKAFADSKGMKKIAYLRFIPVSNLVFLM